MRVWPATRSIKMPALWWKSLWGMIYPKMEINDVFAKHFKESQIFRIDHYLGKESVQNLMALRFGNSFLN